MNTSVEVPSISGRLFNCSLNCALPTLMDNLQNIAFESDTRSIPHIQAYADLKSCFERWYQLQEPLTFANFYAILASFTHREQELILAPVLRQFMVLKCEDVEQKQRIGNLIKFNNEFIDFSVLQALQDAQLDIALSSEGRYMPLDASEANKLFYQHFGLYFEVTEAGVVKNPRPTSSDFTVISAYLRTGHYELSDNPSCKDFEEAFKDKFLLNAYKSMIEDDSFIHTNAILASFIPYVSNKISVVWNEKKSMIHAQDYLKKAKALKLHDDTDEGKMTFAIILLTLMQNDERTQAYASHQLAILQEPVRERLNKVNDLIDEISKMITPSEASTSSCSPGFSELAQYFDVSKMNQVSLENQISADAYYQKATKEHLHGSSFTERMTFALIVLNLMANEENEFAIATLQSFKAYQKPSHDEKKIGADDLLLAIESELNKPLEESKLIELTHDEKIKGADVSLQLQKISQVDYTKILSQYQSRTWLNTILSIFGYKHVSGTFMALKSLENQVEISVKDIAQVLERPASWDSAHHRRFLFWTEADSSSYFKETSGTDQLLKTLKQKF